LISPLLSEVNEGSDFGTWSKALDSSNRLSSSAVLSKFFPSMFTGLFRSSKGSVNLPEDGYVEPETDSPSRTTNGSSTMLVVGFKVETDGFLVLSSLVLLKFITNIMKPTT
jgi:hypothetical protein